MACVAIVHGGVVGSGGLGLQAANTVAALARPGVDLHLFGPGPPHWLRSTPLPPITWHPPPQRRRPWVRLPLFRRAAARTYASDELEVGRWAARGIRHLRPTHCYAFTRVALESFVEARALGIPTILDSPNGHIRAFRQVYWEEARRWCRGRWLGDPSVATVERVEEEYRLADRIRVSSEWAKASLVTGGVPERKISVVEQGIDLERYRPGGAPASDPVLRVVSVGTLDLRKGFVYLLRAVRAMGAGVSLRLVGGTADRCSRRLLERERRGLDVVSAAADPLQAYHDADVCAIPTLEDGQPFVASEAMASGLPLIVTDRCGARDWVVPGRTGWVVPGRDVDALAAALTEAREHRDRLRDMGLEARRAMEARMDPGACDARLADWVLRPNGS